MPIFRLTSELAFPDPSYAEKEGILAVGGDLSVDRLVLAYANGIFPWPHRGAPLLWFSPDPRMVMLPEEFRISNSLRQLIRSKKYTCTFDRAFPEVIRHCATVPRKGQSGTWITNDMVKAYLRMHREGYAHSAETWYDGKLVGGLYGISLGKVFFGESMYHNMRDASKFAFYCLVEQLKAWDFELIDVQQDTEHMRSMGARAIPREKFMAMLEEAVSQPTYKGNWNNYL